MRRSIWAAALVSAAATAACGGTSKAPATVTPPPTTPVGAGSAATTPVTPATPAPAAAVGHPSNDLIPRKVFFDNPDRVAVQISPDGKFVSWLAAKDGVLNVWVAPADKLDAARAVTADATRPVRTYQWSFDGKHLLYQQDQGGNENFHVFRVDVVAGGDAVDLTPADAARAEILGLSPKRPGTLLVGLNDRDPKFHDVYEVDIASGKRTKVYENPKYAGFVVDHDLHVRLSIEAKPDGSNTFAELAPTKGKQPFTLTVPNDDALTSDAEGFDKRGTKLYFNDSRGRDTSALFTIDLATGKQTLVAQDPRADVGAVMMHPTDYTLQAVEFDYQKATWTILDKKIKPDFDALAKVAPGRFDPVSRTLDDKTWVVVFQSDVQPAAYYRWDRKSKKATFLFSARPALEKLTLAHATPEVIKARDGLELVSYLTLPAAADPDGDGKPSAPLPTVLFVHGGPWARDHWGFSPAVQMLANRGYAVLQVNYRGSTGFGKNFVNAGNLQWGKKMHDDLLDAVEWLVTSGVAPRDHIAIMGGSYGGYATLAGVSMTPDVFACGVDIVGPSNLITLVKTVPPYWAPLIATFKLRMGDWETEAGAKALTEVSPLTHAGAIKRPLLIGQGANDPRVNVAESDQIVKAMQAKAIPVSYVLFPDEGHGFARPENNLAFYAVAEAFLSAHLGGAYQPMSKDDFTGSTITIKAGKEGIPGLPAGL
jgi:dipeptidyl aminopeptidase/acylaminoacyl peptidase